jgi:cell division septation protein DedD
MKEWLPMNENRARINIKLKDKPAKVEQTSDVLQQSKAVQQSRAAKEEIAVGDELKDSFGDLGPKYTAGETTSRSLSKWHRRKTKTRTRTDGQGAKSIIAVLLSACGAIIVGLIFGYIILAFFQSGQVSDSKSPNTISESEPAVTQSPTIITGSDPQKAVNDNALIPPEFSNKTTVMVDILKPAQQYYVVQAGVFQDQESAKPLLEQIKAKGWPNAFFDGDTATQYLFLGMALERDHILAMAEQFKGVEIFVKEYVEPTQRLSVPQEKGQNSLQEEWDAWLQNERNLFAVMGKGISEGLTSGKLSEGSMKEITASHRDYLQKGRELLSKLPEESQSIGSRLLNDFTKGVTAMERFQKQASAGYLWQAEQALLDVYKSKNSFYQTFK